MCTISKGESTLGRARWILRSRGTDMGEHPTDFQGDVSAAIRDAVCAKMPGARVDVAGGGGHYAIAVTSEAFSGLSMLASQRLVYAAIAHLMSGERPPVHAVDTLMTKAR
jgi:acid stress-induced BolA-like protein IbaG/YrbA